MTRGSQPPRSPTSGRGDRLPSSANTSPSISITAEPINVPSSNSATRSSHDGQPLSPASGSDALPAAAKPQSNTFYRSCEISLMEPVGSMSISPANRDVVLAARKGLFIIDLEDPYATPRFLAHMTTWEAVDIQWSPHPARSNWVASTSNQKLLVWNLDRPGDPRAAPAISRVPLHVGSHHLPPSSPVIPSRLSVQQGVYGAAGQSATTGTAASTGFGHMSQGSGFPNNVNLMAASTSPSYSAIIQPRSSAIEHILHAHTRAITDINWSPFHPELLASSGIDTWTWVWDLRMSDAGRTKPAQGYSAWNAAVTQVKFNRASEHRLASTCDNKVLIWDDRKGSLPLATIEAHESKIYSIDWSRDTSLGLDRLLTCSLDRSVKFWDLSTESAQAAIGARELVTEPESVIETNTPVWRARHLPFGNGVMTLPQRGDTTLSMWAKDHPEAPMTTFEGHTDIVKEYLFRTKGGQNRDSDDRRFQLITWSKDQTLRLWPVSEQQTRAVGHKPGAPIRVLLTRAYAPDISYRDPPLMPMPSAGVPPISGSPMQKSGGSNSNITISSIVPPEHTTRSLLTGKGSGTRMNGGSPYGSSQSGFQGLGRDGRTSPITAFSASFGARPLDRQLNHSSSNGNLGGGLSVSRKQIEHAARSLGRSDAEVRSTVQQLATSLPKSVTGGDIPRLSGSYHSGKLATSNKSGGSFKVPPSVRDGRSSFKMGSHSAGTRNAVKTRRSHPIKEELESGTDGQTDEGATQAKGKERAKAKERAKKKGLEKSKRSGKGALGAPMRLDRARMTGPAVDPIGWIANVRMQKDPSLDTRASDDTAVVRGSGSDGREATNLRGATSGGDTDVETGLSAQRLGDEIVSLSRKFPRIVFEKIELAQRTVTFTLYGPWADREPAFLRVTMVFPAAYPRKPPKFELEKSASLTLKTRAFLVRGLVRLASRSAEVGRSCCEICARFLLGEPVDFLDDDDEDGGMTSGKGFSYGSLSDSDEDGVVVAPRPRSKMPARSMGASFGPNNELVLYGLRAPSASSRPGSRNRMLPTGPADWRADVFGSGSGSSSRSRSKVRRSSNDTVEAESRFLRSYTALSGAMLSLAQYARQEGSGSGEYGVRDSDVVQLMSSDFFARRMMSRAASKDPSGGETSTGEERRGRGKVQDAVQLLQKQRLAASGGLSTVVRIVYPLAQPAGHGWKGSSKPPLLRRRSSSVPTSPRPEVGAPAADGRGRTRVTRFADRSRPQDDLWLS